MRKYPVTHNTEAGIVIERGLNQFFIRLYVGKAGDGTRKHYSKTWKTFERATQDLLEQKLNDMPPTITVERVVVELKNTRGWEFADPKQKSPHNESIS
jgi:hypothetical protein